MSDENPYTAPDADLATASEELYQPTIFSFSGRLGRLRYLAYGWGTMLVLMVAAIPIMGGGAAMMGGGSGESMSPIMLGLVGIIYLAVAVLSIGFGKRRLNDLNRSGWWMLALIVPIVSLFLAIYMFFFAGTEGSNNYGPAPVANTIGVKILGLMIPAIMLLGIVAAIVIPMLAGTGG
ncbi:MAG: uncharacterized membrane protein YhaH (DUF805 family) [Gammaproteobacteria bacterium]|jgi:uncharacterized membrane protein YhaH (DUF805 family)